MFPSPSFKNLLLLAKCAAVLHGYKLKELYPDDLKVVNELLDLKMGIIKEKANGNHYFSTKINIFCGEL